MSIGIEKARAAVSDLPVHVAESADFPELIVFGWPLSARVVVVIGPGRAGAFGFRATSGSDRFGNRSRILRSTTGGTTSSTASQFSMTSCQIRGPFSLCPRRSAITQKES